MRYIKMSAVAGLMLGLAQGTAEAYQGIAVGVGNVGVAVSPAVPAIAVNVAQRPDQWRYKWNNGRWWYWAADNRWMWYVNNQWTYYVPGGYSSYAEPAPVPYSAYYAPSYSYNPSYGYSYPYSGYPRYYGGYGPGVSVGFGNYWGGYGHGAHWNDGRGHQGHGHDGHGHEHDGHHH